MRIFNQSEERGCLTIISDIPQKLEYCVNSPAKASFSDGTCDVLACMNCKNPSCMQFSKGEIDCIELASFPSDKNSNVCPVEAITWNAEKNIPEINADKCICCGICLRRCPVGAIYYDGIMKVNTCYGSKQSQMSLTKEVIKNHNEQIEQLDSVERLGVPIIENDDILTNIYQKLFRINHNLHNIIVRNLLIALGCNCSIRRIGDVYTRMDAFYSTKDDIHGAVEVEFGRETLDASRAILDDIAVLYTRYNIPKDDNSPLVVCLQLPNARQGYWQVVKDVKTVEDIVINTVTIGSLIILNWNGCQLSPNDFSYYLDYDNTNLRKSISQQIGRELNISNKLLGIFEPIK